MVVVVLIVVMVTKTKIIITKNITLRRIEPTTV